MQRIALGIEYNGANYAGWQRQRHSPSIQAHIESALSKIAAHPVAVFCAGRTDAGVHASGQVLHFDTPSARPLIAWVRGVNAYLPSDIRVLWVKPVSSDFDARKSALSRRYCYIIANQPVSPGIMHKTITWVLSPLDAPLMQTGANFLLGNHDFSSFRAAQCQAKSPVRTLHDITITRKNEQIIVDVTANAFLHHMVRNIVGTLISVGQKKYPCAWIQDVLHAKDRRAAGLTAPSNGLYLVKVSYPDKFEIPLSTAFSSPWFCT
jgi:tRNA pseudouridine38-40 synthase